MALRKQFSSAALILFLISGSHISHSAASHTELHDNYRVTAPMEARVTRVCVTPGQHVERGEVLFISEVMKMEHSHRAQRSGYIHGHLPRAGQDVERDETMCMISLVPQPPVRTEHRHVPTHFAPTSNELVLQGPALQEQDPLPASQQQGEGPVITPHKEVFAPVQKQLLDIVVKRWIQVQAVEFHHEPFPFPNIPEIPSVNIVQRAHLIPHSSSPITTTSAKRPINPWFLPHLHDASRTFQGKLETFLGDVVDVWAKTTHSVIHGPFTHNEIFTIHSIPTFDQWGNFAKSLFLFSILYFFAVHFLRTLAMVKENSLKTSPFSARRFF